MTVGFVEILTWNTNNNGGIDVFYSPVRAFEAGLKGHAALRVILKIDKSVKSLLKNYSPLTSFPCEIDGEEGIIIYLTPYEPLEGFSIVSNVGKEVELIPSNITPLKNMVRPIKFVPNLKGLSHDVSATHTKILSYANEAKLRLNIPQKSQQSRIKGYVTSLLAAEQLDQLEQSIAKLLDSEAPYDLTPQMLTAIQTIKPGWKLQVIKTKKQIKSLLSTIQSKRDTQAIELEEGAEAIHHFITRQLEDVLQDIQYDLHYFDQIHPSTLNKVMQIIRVFENGHELQAFQQNPPYQPIEGDAAKEVEDFFIKEVHNRHLPAQTTGYLETLTKDNIACLQAFCHQQQGISPSHIIRLPLESNEMGLRLEAMLQTAHLYHKTPLPFQTNHQDGLFIALRMMASINSSAEILQIIKSGLSHLDSEMKIIDFNESFFATPQIVHNTMIQIQTQFLSKASSKTNHRIAKRTINLYTMQQTSFSPQRLAHASPCMIQAESAQRALDLFESSAKSRQLPFFDERTKKILFSAIECDTSGQLEARYYKVCNHLLATVYANIQVAFDFLLISREIRIHIKKHEITHEKLLSMIETLFEQCQDHKPDPHKLFLSVMLNTKNHRLHSNPFPSYYLIAGFARRHLPIETHLATTRLRETSGKILETLQMIVSIQDEIKYYNEVIPNEESMELEIKQCMENFRQQINFYQLSFQRYMHELAHLKSSLALLMTEKVQVFELGAIISDILQVELAEIELGPMKTNSAIERPTLAECQQQIKKVISKKLTAINETV